eukprot:1153088-Pelagomonas_calceolata.AAC.15
MRGRIEPFSSSTVPTSSEPQESIDWHQCTRIIKRRKARCTRHTTMQDGQCNWLCSRCIKFSKMTACCMDSNYIDRMDDGPYLTSIFEEKSKEKKVFGVFRFDFHCCTVPTLTSCDATILR